MAKNREQIKNIWMLSREYGELAGAGGVKDVVCQLAESLGRWTRRSVHVVLPLYGFIQTKEVDMVLLEDPFRAGRTLELQIRMDHPHHEVLERVRYYYKKYNGVHLYFVDADRYQQKSNIYTYTEEDERREPWQKKSMGHHDYFAMNLLLQKAALELIIALDVKPDVIHCHDGHTATLPGIIREYSGYRSYFRRTGCLVTVHNAGYGYHQEVADLPYAQSISGLPARVIHNNQLGGKFDPFLLAGEYALINTVSENYARELQESENDSLTGWLGHELLRRHVVVEGISNGIDPGLFSPKDLYGGDDPYAYDPASWDDDLLGKKMCKQRLLESLGNRISGKGLTMYGSLLNDAEMVLLVFIGRLSEQKGIDTLLEVLPVLMAKEMQIQAVILGSGSDDIESRLVQLTEEELIHGRMCFIKGYNTEFANRLYAGGDFLVIPSRYEPCGLTDFIAQLFGTVPVVHHVGGLVKVLDGLTGLAYEDESPGALLGALVRALRLYEKPVELKKMQVQAVKEIKRNYTWSTVMKKYVELYRRARDLQLNSL